MENCPECNKEVPQEFDICWNCSFNFTTREKEGFISENIKYKPEQIKAKKLNCLRCKTTMKFEQTIKLHEGTNWGAIGEIGHLFTNKESFDLYLCPNCEKIEFFAPSVSKAK